jgi:hypothetical protein
VASQANPKKKMVKNQRTPNFNLIKKKRVLTEIPRIKSQILTVKEAWRKVTKAKRGTRVNTGGSDFEFGAGLKIFLKTEPGDGYDVYEDPFVKYSLLGAVQDNKFVESVEVRIKENLPESTFHQKYGMGSFN